MVFRIARGLAFVLVCVAMFDVPSSLVMTRGSTPWLALVVGAAAFPIVPLMWHLLRERRRRPGTTTGWTRFVYRTLAIAAITFATVLVTARAHVRDALHDHLLWFLPDRTVWLRSDPSALGSRAVCEAFSTMEMKCEDVVVDYTALVHDCEEVVDQHRQFRPYVNVTLTIEVAEVCALRTAACDDYHACISAGGHGW